MTTDAMVLQLFEQSKTHIYGKYKGIVTEVEPATMRVKAIVKAVLGDTPTGWADPCVPFAGKEFGIAFLPQVGSGVWIEFEGGNTSHPIWTGSYWYEGEYLPEVKENVQVITTPAKQKIIFDGDNGKVEFSDENGNKVTIDSSGITLERGSMKVVVSDTSVNVNSGALEVK